jgi:hypothetical protein
VATSAGTKKCKSKWIKDILLYTTKIVSKKS